MSEEVHGRVTEKLFHAFSDTETWFFSVLSKPAEILQNPKVRAHSGPVPETSGSLNIKSQGKKDPRPEVEVPLSESPQELVPEENSYCCSTPAKPAAEPHQLKGHPNGQNKLKRYYSQSYSKLQLSYLFEFHVHIYRCISFTYPYQLYIPTAFYLYGTKLKQTRTEPILNKQIFAE